MGQCSAGTHLADIRALTTGRLNYMNFEQEILRLCEEAVACKSEVGGAELARQAQAMMHARIEGLRGNLSAMPPLRDSCLGLVVGAFLMDGAAKVARPVGTLQKNHDDLEALRKRLSEAQNEYARSRRSLLRRLLGSVPDALRRRIRPDPTGGSDSNRSLFKI